jgi:hypothetical protein
MQLNGPFRPPNAGSKEGAHTTSESSLPAWPRGTSPNAVTSIGIGDGGVGIEEVGLNDQGGSGFAVVALHGNGDQIISFHFQRTNPVNRGLLSSLSNRLTRSPSRSPAPAFLLHWLLWRWVSFRHLKSELMPDPEVQLFAVKIQPAPAQRDRSWYPSPLNKCVECSQRNAQDFGRFGACDQIFLVHRHSPCVIGWLTMCVET